MRIAHIADVHLGYRAYTRVTSRGLNQREADVFKSFRNVLNDVQTLDPDVVIIAGDLFHTVRPSNFMIHQTFLEFSRFRADCKAPIVIIGGNHDTPKSIDTGCILDLFTTIPNIHVHHHGFTAVSLPEMDAAVYCLPYFSLELRREYTLKPDEGPSVNVLAVHGTVEGVMKQGYDLEQIQPGELHYDAWDYIALGHYHIRTEIAPNCYYSGAIDFTSSNIWEEARTVPKGFILFDTDTQEMTFHETKGIRPVLELSPVRAEDCSAEEVMERIERAIQPHESGLESKIIRLIVEGFPRQLHKELDWQRLRQLKSSALHFDVVMRPVSETGRTQTSVSGQANRPLEVEWDEFAGSLEDIPQGIDRSRLISMGRQYLAAAQEQEVAL